MHRPTEHEPAIRRRRAPVIVALSTVIGLWFGLTAPSVSPVAATPPTVSSVTADPAVPGG